MSLSAYGNDFLEFVGLSRNYNTAQSTWSPQEGTRLLELQHGGSKRAAYEEAGAIVYDHLVYYPTPAHIHYWWGFGFLAFIFLAIQIITGILLAMFYKASIYIAFESIVHLMTDVPYGWLLRYAHANGASVFFIIVYCHIGRGLYYGSFVTPRAWVWISGVVIFFLIIVTAFIGYVLPWGQMSFWGATVITNLLTAIPLVGTHIVQWIWGGFSVGDATLNRFFSLHYLVPFIIAVLGMVHIYLLHGVGSNNPTGLSSKFDNNKIPFSPFFAVKDAGGFFAAMVFYFFLVMFEPDLLGHPDNYTPANPIVTPAHIVPEWYFLPFYAILRAVPDKLGGVVAIGGAIIILAVAAGAPLYKLLYEEGYVRRPVTLLPFSNYYFWLFVSNFLFLGWLGGKPAEEPFVTAARLSSLFYFSWFLFFPFLYWLENAWQDNK